jgi:serine/threonine protein kinase
VPEPQSQRSFAANDRIGDLEICELIGEGGMGQVYKARHTRLDRIVAVKVLKSDHYLKDDELVLRFQREMRALGKLDHPNVIRPMDAREEDGVQILVLEFADGIDLFRLLKSRGGWLGLANACEVVRQTASGLSEIHRHGLIHRDIKPSNLQLTRSGVVKILDLGIALLHGMPKEMAITRSTHIVGTLDFMAPEQIDDSRTVDRRADFYSLGCTLYFLLSGRAPYQDSSSAAAKIQAHLQLPFPDTLRARSMVPAEVLSILERMVAKDPQQRFSEATQICDALAPFCKESDLRKLLTDSAPGESNQDPYATETVSSRWPAKSTKRDNEPEVQATVASTRSHSWAKKFAVPVACVAGIILLSLLIGSLARHDPPSSETATPPVDLVVSPDQYGSVLRELQQLNSGFEGELTDCFVEEGTMTLDLAKYGKQIKNIAPLRRMRLTTLHLDDTAVSDLSPLREMRLHFLYCARTEVQDLSPLSGMPLIRLDVSGTPVSSLEPIREMNRLIYLACDDTEITDLSPLTNSYYEEVNVALTRVSDLTPLAGCKIDFLSIEESDISDIEPLKTIVGLRSVWLDYRSEYAQVLKSIDSLKKINDQPVTRFWAQQSQSSASD